MTVNQLSSGIEPDRAAREIDEMHLHWLTLRDDEELSYGEIAKAFPGYTRCKILCQCKRFDEGFEEEDARAAGITLSHGAYFPAKKGGGFIAAPEQFREKRRA